MHRRHVARQQPSRPFCLLVIVAAAGLVPAGAAAQARWSVVEELRIGNGESEALTFSDVRGIAVGTGGQFFVLDFKTQEIRLFDASGKFVKNIARRGRGPGEIAQANGVVQARDGTIWVNDPANSRFTLFRPDGSFLRQHTVPVNSYGFLWGGLIDVENRVYDPIMVPDGKGGTTPRIRRLTSTGAVADTIDVPACGSATPAPLWRGRSTTGSTVMAIPFQPVAQHVLDPRGFAWCTRSDAYRLARVRLGRGDTVAVIDRKATPPPVTAAERRDAVARADSVLRRYEQRDADYSLIPRVKPMIEALDIDDAGRLWVRLTPADRTRAVFDVFGDDGRHVATAEVPFRMSRYIHPVIRGDVMYAVALDEDDVPMIVRARINR